MQRFYPERETSGPEFDNKLIQLVKANPAIYDVSHPHYRRNPVRVAIWDRIAAQLGAPSRFLQTKWKNIRYNYLQEVKCLETGITNPNIRKRRFTEDLSFLQNTAQSYNVKKAQMYRNSMVKGEGGSDNDSNGYIYPDPDFSKPEVIEIGNSDDEGSQNFLHQNGDFYENNTIEANHQDEDYEDDDDDDQALASFNVETELKEIDDGEVEIDNHEESLKSTINLKNETLEIKLKTEDENSTSSPNHLTSSNPSSPLITPIVVMANGDDTKTTNGEITIERIPKTNTNNNLNQTISTNSHSQHNGQKSSPSSSSTTTNRDSNNHSQHHQHHHHHHSSSRLNNQSPYHHQSQTKKRMAASEIMTNIAKRKSMPAPFPCLTPINDPIELYCLSLVDCLRNMPRSERERVKFEFANILKDAKYKDQS